MINLTSLINTTLLKEQLRRFYLIPTVVGFIYMLSFMLVGRYNTVITRLLDIITHNDLILLTGSILLPLVSVACVMGFFVSQKSGVAFYSLPIKKDVLILTNALAGIILTLAPLLLLGLFMLIPIQYNVWTEGISTMFSFETGLVTHSVWDSTPEFPRGLERGDIINTIPVVLGFLIRISITKLFFFGIFWLAFSLTGYGFVAMLLGLFIPLFPAGLMGLSTAIGRIFVYGYHGGVQNSFTLGLIWTNPIWSTWLVGDRAVDSVILIALWYLLLTVIVLVSAFFVSRLRMVERFEETVMFLPLRQIMIFVIAVVVMAISTLFLMILLPSSPLVFYASLIIGFIIGFYVAQIIIGKTFLLAKGFKIKQLIAHSTVVFGIFVIILIVTQFGLGFYVNRIPDNKNIVGVFPGPINLDWEEYLFLRDPNSISTVKNIHQELLNNQTPIFTPVWRGTNSYTLYLTYLLDNGRTLQRRYIVPREFMLREDVEALKTGEEMVLNRFVFLNHPEHIMELTIDIMDTFREQFSLVDQEKIALFTEAIRQDMLYQATITYRIRHTMLPDGHRNMHDFTSEHTSILIGIAPRIEMDEPSFTRLILVMPNYTINLMEEWGLL